MKIKFSKASFDDILRLLKRYNKPLAQNVFIFTEFIENSDEGCVILNFLFLCCFFFFHLLLFVSDDHQSHKD